MSETSAVPAEATSPTSRVDAHLQSWRTETQRRRNAWAIKHADFVADQRRRRERTMVFAASASFGFVATLGLAFLVASQLSATSPFSVEPAASPFTAEPAAVVSAAPVAVIEPVVDAPIEPAVVTPQAPVVQAPTAAPVVPSEAVSTPAPPAPAEPTAAELGATSVTSWTRNGTLWIQVDTVPGRELRWLDGRGNEVLERTPCSYALPDGGMRCYIGRTRARIDMALGAGAAPGSWRADLCDGDACTTVATYPIGH